MESEINTTAWKSLAGVRRDGHRRRFGSALVVLLAALALAPPETVGAATRYVTDEINVMLRSGENTSFKILAGLRSGAKLVLLGTNPETGYSKVRTSKGEEGFVLTQYLSKLPSARNQLAKATKQLAKLKQDNSELSARLATVAEEKSVLETDQKSLLADKRGVEESLEELHRTASSTIAIAEERDSLRDQTTALQDMVEALRQENGDLKNRTAQRWALIGAGVLFGGILLGLILPRMRFRRRRSWDSI